MTARPDQRGFTLIELMVALVLFSFAMAGVLAVAVSMTQGSAEQKRAVASMDAARGALDYIAEAARQISPACSTGSDQDVWTSCSSANAMTTPVKVTDGGTGVNASSDILDIIYASGGVATTTRTAYTSSSNTSVTLSDASQLTAGDMLMLTDGSTGLVVKTTDVNTSTGVVTLSAPTCSSLLSATGFAAGSYAVRAMRARFYIGTFDGVSNILLVDPDGPDGPLTAEPLAENVEDFQVAVGYDADNSGGVDSNEWAYAMGAGSVTATNLRAIRITIVVKDSAPVPGGPSSGLYTRPAAENHNAAATADNYRRRVLTSTIEIRNMGGSP